MLVLLRSWIWRIQHKTYSFFGGMIIMVGIAKSLERIADRLTRNTLLASTFGVVDIVVTNITATTGQHLSLVAVTGKDIIMKLTDASGARKFLIKDSADATVASIDSDGNITGTLFTGNVTGDVTGDLAGGVTFPASTGIDFAGAHADYTLDTTERKSLFLSVTNADAAANIIAPAANRMYIVKNASGQAITVKKTGGTGVAIANGKTAIVVYGGSDYIRATADSTN